MDCVAGSVEGETLPLPQLDTLGKVLSGGEPVPEEQWEGEPLCDGEDDAEPLNVELRVPLADADRHAEEEGEGEPLDVGDGDALLLGDGDAVA